VTSLAGDSLRTTIRDLVPFFVEFFVDEVSLSAVELFAGGIVMLEEEVWMGREVVWSGRKV
jgi:hypothetical protein